MSILNSLKRWRRSLIPTMCVLALLFSVTYSQALAQSESAAGPAPSGLVQLASDFDVATTGDRLAAVLDVRNLTLMARIDHAANAASVGKALRDTELFIFGNPAVGTPLMQCSQSVAIDLPQKMLIWQDEAGQVWLGYNDPAYLKTRHNIEGCDRVLERVSQVLSDIASRVTQAT